MSMRAAGFVLATAFLVAGCSGTEAETPEVADVQETADSVTGAEEAAEEQEDEATEEPEPEPTMSEDEGAMAGGEEATVLLASVGTEEDPEAFVITLTDESGAEVTELPAGDYVIEVTDPATTHNFHLMGGSVDEATSVPELQEETWEVTLEPGEYTYTCDPHPPMTGTFTVTG